MYKCELMVRLLTKGRSTSITFKKIAMLKLKNFDGSLVNFFIPVGFLYNVEHLKGPRRQMPPLCTLLHVQRAISAYLVAEREDDLKIAIEACETRAANLKSSSKERMAQMKRNSTHIQEYLAEGASNYAKKKRRRGSGHLRFLKISGNFERPKKKTKTKKKKK